MRVVKYFLALWAAVAVYSGFSFYAGLKGISAYRELAAEREKQELNMKTLERINQDLENTKNALLYDRDTIRVYARGLGFGEQDEKFVRIVGLGQARNSPLSPGEVRIAEEGQAMKQRTILLISIFAALAVFIPFLISDILEANLEPEYKREEEEEFPFPSA
jgi:cell division protein FtsB